MPSSHTKLIAVLAPGSAPGDPTAPSTQEAALAYIRMTSDMVLTFSIISSRSAHLHFAVTCRACNQL